LTRWLEQWRPQLAAGAGAQMRKVNPWMIARNAAVEHALQAASSQGDLQPFKRLLRALGNPFAERPEFADLAMPAPREQAKCYKTFCGT
jgi:uncharacterized protein YdiU (UPF0061 family)